jgi:putative aldouronate transport system permease protein
MRKKEIFGQALLHVFFVVLSLMYIIPFLLLVAISFTDETILADYGYSLIPKQLSLEAYKHIFENPKQLIDSYQTTILFTVLYTVFTVVVTTMTAYPLSRSNFRYKKALTWYIFITMIFGGGLVPSYLVNTKLLNLDNTIWIYVLPGLVSAWNVIIVRTFFQGIPESLAESAKIDGASEFGTFIRIMIPLSTPVMATIGFLQMVAKWNDWNTALIYIKDTQLYSLQYMLQRILREVEFVKQMASQSANFNDYEVPTESIRYATALLAAGPMIIVFPFFQKYFTKGMTIGAVKG